MHRSEDAVDGHRLFNVIINGDWDNPEYTMSYDSSKTDFSVTVPGLELKGKSSIRSRRAMLMSS